jgi:hypothetical protein
LLVVDMVAAWGLWNMERERTARGGHPLVTLQLYGDSRIECEGR